MRKLRKILVWVLAVFAIVFLVATMIIALYGKRIVEGQIEQNLRMKTRLGSMALSFPFTIHINNLEIGDLFKADRIAISPNIFSLFPGKLILGKVVLIRPLINLKQESDGSLNIPKLKQKGAQQAVFITGLVIEEGRFIYTDRKIKPEGFKVLLNNINAGISKVNFPITSLDVHFRISADIADRDYKSIGSIAATGRVDFMRKNMDANLKIKDLDATYFSLYYGNFISKNKLLSARLNFNSDFKAENNDLNINSNFRLSNLVYAKDEQKEGEVPEFNLAKDALDFFTDKDGNLVLDFKIKTKLDNPSLSIAELKKIILKAALKNLISADPQTLMDKVQQNIEKFEELGKQFKKIFK
jgi:uncharacterized protein involved in outer membrane biogenesis